MHAKEAEAALEAAEAAEENDPAKEAGVDTSEAADVITEALAEEKTGLPAEEELAQSEDNSIVDTEEARDKTAENE